MKNKFPTRYTSVAIALHWLVALLVITLIAVGLTMDRLPLSPLKFEIFQLHKSIGLTVLLLVVARLAWRLTHRPPVLPAGTKGWEKGLAHATHWSLYLLLLAMPLFGWIFSDAAGYHPSLFGLPVPVLSSQNPETANTFKQLHEFGGYTILTLLVLHVGAALKHHFLKKDDVLQRMLPRWITIPRLFALALPMLLLSPAARAEIWNINPSASSLGFIASFNGEPVRGTFKNWNGRIFFDAKNLSASDINISVSTGSVSTGEMGRDKTLQSPDWFNTAQFPNAVFTCTNISALGNPGAYLANGTLSIGGMSKPLQFPFRLEITDDKARMRADIPLSRLAFNVGKGVWQTSTQIADTVTVTVVLNATKSK